MAIKLPEGFSQWDSAEHIKTEEDMQFYLDACLEEDDGDGRLIRHAIGVIAPTSSPIAKSNV